MCYFVAVMIHAFVFPILEHYSPVSRSAAECQIRERQVCLVARLCPGQSLLSLLHRCHVTGLCMLYKVNSNSNICLFSELPFVSTMQSSITGAAVAVHS